MYVLESMEGITNVFKIHFKIFENFRQYLTTAIISPFCCLQNDKISMFRKF